MRVNKVDIDKFSAAFGYRFTDLHYVSSYKSGK